MSELKNALPEIPQDLVEFIVPKKVQDAKVINELANLGVIWVYDFKSIPENEPAETSTIGGGTGRDFFIVRAETEMIQVGATKLKQLCESVGVKPTITSEMQTKLESHPKMSQKFKACASLDLPTRLSKKADK